MFSESPFEGSLFECYWCVVLFSEISFFRDRQGTNERKEKIKDVVWPTLSLLGKIQSCHLDRLHLDTRKSVVVFVIFVGAQRSLEKIKFSWKQRMFRF